MFPANSRAALSAYGTVGVETILDSASPHRLVLMLFEGARVAVAKAHMHMRLGEIAAKGEALVKAICIIDQGLKASLDAQRGGELAVHLQQLYDYMVSRITHANLRNDPQPLEEVGRLLAELEGAWRQIGRDAAGPVLAPEQDLRSAPVQELQSYAAPAQALRSRAAPVQALESFAAPAPTPRSFAAKYSEV